MRGLTQVDSDSEDEQPLLRLATVSSGVIEVGDASPRLASQSTVVDNDLPVREVAHHIPIQVPEMFALSDDEPRAPARTSRRVVLVPECGDTPQSICDRSRRQVTQKPSRTIVRAPRVSWPPLSLCTTISPSCQRQNVPHQATLSLRMARGPTRRVAANSTSPTGD